MRVVLDIVSISPHGRRRVASLHTRCVAPLPADLDGRAPVARVVPEPADGDRPARACHPSRPSRLRARRRRDGARLSYPPRGGRRGGARRSTSGRPAGTDTATLRVACDRPRLTLTVLHVGPETVPTRDDHTSRGDGAGPAGDGVGRRDADRQPPLSTSGGPGRAASTPPPADRRRPDRLRALRRARGVPGQARVAASVLPTNTWQAYNRADTDGDGLPDTWYATPARWEVPSTGLCVPWGLPGGFRNYDLPFLHWLEHQHPAAALDYLVRRRPGGCRSGRRWPAIRPGHVLGGHEE